MAIHMPSIPPSAVEVTLWLETETGLRQSAQTVVKFVHNRDDFVKLVGEIWDAHQVNVEAQKVSWEAASKKSDG